ncbi:MAG: hypothetical protein WBQ21_09910 [Solirubrobacteraceae bacterium]
MATDHPPPPPTSIFVGTDSNGSELPRDTRTYADIIYLKITANECTNPATVEGILFSSNTPEKLKLKPRRSNLPNQAMVTIYGAHVRSLAIDLVSIPLYPVLATDTESVNSIEAEYGITTDSHLLPLIHQAGATIGIFDSPQWPSADAYMHFIAKVDLIRPASFDSCYLDLPQLLGSEGGRGDPRAYGFASLLSAFVGRRAPHFMHNNGPIFENVDAGEVQASVNNRIVEQSTIGNGGEPTANGVRYLCHSGTPMALPPRLDPKIARSFIEPEPSDCAGAPLFQAVNITSDTTRRLLESGIIGSIAATLLIETLFIAETKPKDPETKQGHRSERIGWLLRGHRRDHPT